MEDDEDPPALLGSEGAGTGEVGAEEAAGADSVGISSAPEVRPSVVSAMAQAHEASQVVVSTRKLSHHLRYIKNKLHTHPCDMPKLPSPLRPTAMPQGLTSDAYEINTTLERFSKPNMTLTDSPEDTESPRSYPSGEMIGTRAGNICTEAGLCRWPPCVYKGSLTKMEVQCPIQCNVIHKTVYAGGHMVLD